MKIAALHVDGFGRFADLDIQELSPGLTVFHGPNEAGKSTLLAFIRAVLFGFADGRFKENLYPPLAGGRHGGSLVLVDQDGVRYTVQRHAGKRGGDVQVTSPGLPAGGEESLRRLLGSAERGLFRNVFAFSLEELQRLENLDDEDVRSTLYSAGLGSAVVDLPRIERNLTDRAEALFKPRGSKPLINTLLKQLKTTRDSLRELSSQPEKYRQLQDELEALAEQEIFLQDEADRLNLRRLEISRLQQAWDAWVQWMDIQRRLDLLPQGPDFPPDGLARLEALLVRDRDLQTRLQASRRRRGEVELRLASLRPDARVLERREAVRRLGGRRSEWDRLRQELPGQQRQEEELLRQLHERLAGIDPSWDLERLRSCDTSMPARERVRTHRATLSRGTERRDRAEQNLPEAQKVGRETEEHLQTRQRELEQAALPDPALEGLSPRELAEARQRWRSAQEAARQAGNRDREAAATAAEALERLGSGWTRERVRDLEPDRAALEELREHQKRAQRAESALEQAKSAAQASQRQRRELDRELETAQQELEELPSCSRTPEEADCARADLFKARDALREQELHSARRDHARERAATPEPGADLLPVWVAGLPLILALALALALANPVWSLLAQGQMRNLALAVLILAGLVTAALLWWRRSSAARVADQHQAWADLRQQGRQQTEEAERALQQAGTRLAEAARALELSEPVSLEDLNRHERDLHGQSAALERRRSAETSQKRLAERSLRLDESLQEARKTWDTAQENCREGAAAWGRWLTARGLPENLSADLARDRLEEIRHVADLVRRHRALNQAAREAEAEARTLDEGLLATLNSAGRASTGESLDDQVSALLRDCEAQADRVRHLESLREKVEQAQVQTSQARLRLEAAQEEAQTATAELSKAWADWQKERPDLPSGTPETALEILERAASAQENLKSWEQQRARREETEKALNRLHSEACTLLAAAGRPQPLAEELATALDRLVGDLDQAETQATQHAELLKQIEDDHEPPEVLQGQLEKVQADARHLLELAGAADEEAFRRAAESAAERTELGRVVERLKLTITTSGANRPFEDFTAELEAADPDALELEATKLDLELQGHKSDLGKVHQDQGRIQKELENLEHSAERARLHQVEGTLRETLRVRALEWGTLALSSGLLAQARARYEQERQPEVIRRAAEHFAAMTNGRYPRLFAPVGEKRVLVELVDGTRRETSQLSRGTAEQLYLALRLAFVQEFSRRSEPLPLVMDDIFVNFDPQRAQAALTEVLRLTDRHQVLLFTCHPATVERTRQVHPQASVRKLEG